MASVGDAYPVLLQLHNRLCLVVGAGPVGRRKVRGLRQAGARIRWVAPDLPVEASAQVQEALARPYRSDDVSGAFLVFAATATPELNDRICADGRAEGALVNRAEAPEAGDFAVPAVARRGPVLLTVSTGGACPALAALLRDRLKDQVGTGWEEAAALAEELRRYLLETEGDATRCRSLLNEWLTPETLMLLSGRRLEEARDLLWERLLPDDGKGAS